MFKQDDKHCHFLCKKFENRLEEGEYKYYKCFKDKNPDNAKRHKFGLTAVKYRLQQTSPSISIEKLKKEWFFLSKGYTFDHKNPPLKAFCNMINKKFRILGEKIYIHENYVKYTPYHYKCVCKQTYDHFSWLFNKKTHDIIIIGRVCYKRFVKEKMGITKGYSDLCNFCHKVPIKNDPKNKNLCKNCKNIKNDHRFNKIQNWICYLSGMHYGDTYGFIRNYDPDYLEKIYYNKELGKLHRTKEENIQKIKLWIYLNVIYS
tara:strand:- start:23961 stop:24740 length:780 start_codon:yes stop_codon:yes gene_type:complete